MTGHGVLTVPKTDEHGTPILVVTNSRGVNAHGLTDRNNRLAVEDLVTLDLSYNLFTRMTAGNHYAVVQDAFCTVCDDGYMVEQVTRATISPSTGRTLSDHYIESTYPIYRTEGAHEDQCDVCDNQLDPTELTDPHSRINSEAPEFVESTHYPPDLPVLAEVLSK